MVMKSITAVSFYILVSDNILLENLDLDLDDDIYSLYLQLHELKCKYECYKRKYELLDDSLDDNSKLTQSSCDAKDILSSVSGYDFSSGLINISTTLVSPNQFEKSLSIISAFDSAVNPSTAKCADIAFTADKAVNSSAANNAAIANTAERAVNFSAVYCTAIANTAERAVNSSAADGAAIAFTADRAVNSSAANNAAIANTAKREQLILQLLIMQLLLILLLEQ